METKESFNGSFTSKFHLSDDILLFLIFSPQPAGMQKPPPITPLDQVYLGNTYQFK
jgi:hypothetical protein